MHRHVIALLCGLAVAAALLLWRGEPHQEAAPEPPAELSTRPAQPEQVAAPLQPAAPALPATAAASVAPLAAAPAAALIRPPQPSAGSAFALSSDHQALIHQTVLAAADHERLEQEPRDDAWAADAERLIRQELARHARAGDFDLIAVDCRLTLCAIQAFSYGENGHREWVKALDELYKQTLASDFESVNTAFPTQGSRSPVLSFLHRKAATVKP